MSQTRQRLKARKDANLTEEVNVKVEAVAKIARTGMRILI